MLKTFKVLVYKLRHRIGRLIQGDPDGFLKKCVGVAHIGASVGQERFKYSHYGLQVVWIEAIPSVYHTLLENIRAMPNQRAICALLDSEEGINRIFNVSSNSGESSSLLELGDHRRMYPDVTYTARLSLITKTLDSLSCENVNIFNDIEALIIDVQGAELRVLLGARKLLEKVKYVQVEAPDFQAYKDCPTANELVEFMRSAGFQMTHKVPFSYAPNVGTYYNLFFRRRGDF